MGADTAQISAGEGIGATGSCMRTVGLSRERERRMNFDQYTERARGFVQSAQTGALASGHQQFTPEHILKVLLDDPEGLAAGLIERAGGRVRDALAALPSASALVTVTVKIPGAA